MPKGMKTCPNCGKGNGPRSQSCECGHFFIKAEKTRTIATEAGPGRKQCGTCRAFVGVRTAVCECGYDFTRKASAETPEIKKLASALLPDADKFPRIQYTVYAPSGKPFCLPKSNTEEDINVWSDKIVDWGRQNGKLYTTEALLYWLHTYKFDRNLLTKHPYDKEVEIESSSDGSD